MNKKPRGTLRPVSVAPMMDRTDRHFRWLARRFTRRTLLYTEMVTTAAIIHGDRERLLGFSPEERPLALQLGGDDPNALALCAGLAEDLGYDEVNINVGCPSERVHRGSFGACLMARPELVRDGVAAMRSAVSIPVTVKHRIGINGRESYEDLLRFVDVVSRAGCDRFSVHARIAVLGGLTPEQNREVPPLRYHDVYRLKRERPHLNIEINGGIKTLDEASDHLNLVDAVMIGRAVYDNPTLLAGVDARFFAASDESRSLHDVIAGDVADYLDRWLTAGGRSHDVTRHLLGLFSGRPGARAWRRRLSEHSASDQLHPRDLRHALSLVGDPIGAR